MLEIKYEHVARRRNSGTYFAATNESILRWRELLKRIPLYKVGAVCSGGEIGFLSILPLVRQELVLVDNSYPALQIAMFKYMLLRDLGPRKAHELLSSGTFQQFKTEFKKVEGEIPLPLTAIDWILSTNHCKDINKEWRRVSADLVSKACKKLDKVRFVHGSFTDLVDHGPFGLVYLSNALGYHGERRDEQAAQVEKMVRPGGYVVASSSLGFPKHWECLKTETPANYGECQIRWHHQLYRIPASKVAEAA